MIDAYLQIEGIKGESTDDKHKDWLEVSHVLWGVHQPRAATVSTAGGHTSGRAELRNISFSKLADISSPVLLQTCAAGKTIPKAVFEFMRADGDGKPIPYFKVELENVMLAVPRTLTIETAMEWIDADELVEVTPDAVRVRKQILQCTRRPRRAEAIEEAGSRGISASQPPPPMDD